MNVFVFVSPAPEIELVDSHVWNKKNVSRAHKSRTSIKEMATTALKSRCLDKKKGLCLIVCRCLYVRTLAISFQNHGVDQSICCVRVTKPRCFFTK